MRTIPILLAAPGLVLALSGPLPAADRNDTQASSASPPTEAMPLPPDDEPDCE